MRYVSIILAMCFTLTTFAGVDDVKALVEKGEFRKAVSEAEALRKKSPRDATLSYWYAQALLGLGERKEGREALVAAADRGYTSAWQELAQMSLDDYDVSAAQRYLDSWRSALTKAKKAEPAELKEMESTLLLMTNQLNRIDDVPVIAQFSIASSDFDAALARVFDNNIGGTSFVADSVPFFINNTGREVFWTAPDAEGVSRLYTAGILDDGTRDQPTELTQYVGDGDILAPFMMEDGETLYFASNRDGGLGGYDIYMTRRDGNGGFYEPSNVGMPYNSTDNDILFVIDEQNGLGWWVTDRGFATDTLTVNVFVPSATRVNVPADAPNLVERGRLTNPALTLPAGFDLAAVQSRIPHPSAAMPGFTGAASDGTFRLSLGNGRVLTSPSQLRNRRSADLLSQVMSRHSELDETQRQLTDLRKAYGAGDKSTAGEILSLEGKVTRMKKELRNLTNQLIQLETR